MFAGADSDLLIVLVVEVACDLLVLDAVHLLLELVQLEIEI